MSRSVWVFIALGLVLVLGTIVVLSSDEPSSGVVDADRFAELQASGVRVVDVRTAAEFSAGHIPGAENVPLSFFAEASGSWDPKQPIALYCATGSRSAEAAQMLAAKGFETVYDLGGGVMTWRGDLENGADAVVETPSQQPSTIPVMYEFYTDW
jgi:rhodanese-related sulfurtransferase